MPVVKEDPPMNGYEVVGRLMEPVFFLPTMALNVALRGFVLSYLWGWFITPTFSIPAPSVLMCIALSMTLHYFVFGIRLDSRRKTEQEEKLQYSAWRNMLLAIAGHLFVWCVGYIINGFIVGTLRLPFSG